MSWKRNVGLLIGPLCLVATLACGQRPQEASPAGPQLADIARVLGPFPLNDQQFTVVLHEKRIQGVPGPDPYFQITLAEIEIKDATGAVHYQKTFPYEVSGTDFLDTLSVSVQLLRGKDRSGLLLSYGYLPSTPQGGVSWQVWGLFDRKLVPFSPPISLEGDLINAADGNVVQTAAEPGFAGEVLAFRVRTGNFSVIYPVRVDFLLAKAMPAWRCSKMTAQGMQPRCPYRVEADRVSQEEELTFVRLFAEADEGFGTADHVVVKKNSKVEFLAAEGQVDWEEDSNSVGLTPRDDFWIKVRIDGREGWIHTQEDFLAIGLPQAG